MSARLLTGFLLALVLGVTGGTLAVRATSPKPVRAAAAPTAAATVAAPVIRPRDVGTDSGAVRLVARVDPPPASPLATATVANVATASVLDSAPPTAAAAPTDSVQAAAEHAAHARVAKMFGTMQARDAARVLEQMPDDEVIAILTGLRERQAGSIVAELDAKRAAEIGRALLRSRGGSE